MAVSSANIKSIESLNGKVLVDQKGKPFVTLGGCKPGDINIISQNRDSFDSASETIHFPAVAYFYTREDIRYYGEMGYSKPRVVDLKVGTGQME